MEENVFSPFFSSPIEIFSDLNPHFKQEVLKKPLQYGGGDNVKLQRMDNFSANGKLSFFPNIFSFLTTDNH